MSRADELIDSLPSIALAMTARGRQRQIIDITVDGLVEGLHAAMARIWIAGPPGRSRFRTLTVDRSTCLRLRADRSVNVDLSEESGREVMAATWVMRIADTQKAIATSRLYHGGQTPDVSWMRSNRFRAFAGYPLLDGDKLLGVLALFLRYPLNERTEGLLSVFAGQVSAALRNGNGDGKTRSDVCIPGGSSLDEAMRAYIEHILKETGGRIEGTDGAAEALSIHPNTLRSRMNKLGVRRP
ncbi:MAG: GAF domain-containing protein [Rhodothermales bacterium]|nr:GAF domain-containing protein [Rhodothermales bacterium]MBO6778574.1 GAF domain-containing protein [Rhodothermales bacterium]